MIKLTIPSSAISPCPPHPLDARLGAAREFVRGGVLADVGTDHAYLPIALLSEDACTFAVATDIHRGPAELAAANFAAHGIGGDRAAVLLTDGLHGAEDYFPQDICIFGMGGEMIARILEEASWVRRRTIRLILQPMTRAEVLRDYLDKQGFALRAERLCKTDRVYQIMCAEYDGHIREHTPLELLLGEQNLARRDEYVTELAERLHATLTEARAGKLRSTSPDTAHEDALLLALDRYLN